MRVAAVGVPLVARGVIDLERRVRQVVPLGEQRLDPDADLVTVEALGNHDVRGRGRLAGRDLPDVQVVDLDHATGNEQDAHCSDSHGAVHRSVTGARRAPDPASPAH